MFHVPEQYRFSGSLPSTEADGNNGQFLLPPLEGARMLFIQASDGLGWEHVSVHAYVAVRGKRGHRAQRRAITHTPTWAEMCHLKSIFWDDDDVVIQYHPRKEEYVNNHANVLHLWRPTEQVIPTPDSLLVGYRNEEEKEQIVAARI